MVDDENKEMLEVERGRKMAYSISFPLEKDNPDIPLKPMLSIKESDYHEKISIELSEKVEEKVIVSEQETTQLFKSEETKERNFAQEEEIKEKVGEYEAPKTLKSAGYYDSKIEKNETTNTKNPITTFKDVPIEPMPESYLDVKKMVSTAYCHCIKCCGKDENHPAYGITYSGVDLLDGKVHKVVAADVKVLPLGTIVYIKDYGLATVADIGGGIKGDRVDIYFPTHDEACEWAYGMQEIDVYILEYPE